MISNDETTADAAWKSATCIMCKRLFAVDPDDDDYLMCLDCTEELEAETRGD